MLRYCRIILFFALLAVPPVLAGSGDAGKLSPEFVLSDVSGASHHLSDYRGKIVVLNFWATWCPECREEMPSLKMFAQTFGKNDVAVLSISVDRNSDDLKRYLAAFPVSFPVLRDDSGDVFVRTYTLTTLPSTIIVDREGRVIRKIFGKIDFSSGPFIEMMRSLIQGAGSK